MKKRVVLVHRRQLDFGCHVLVAGLPLYLPNSSRDRLGGIHIVERTCDLAEQDEHLWRAGACVRRRNKSAADGEARPGHRWLASLQMTGLNWAVQFVPVQTLCRSIERM
jgi:hypothetical protein